MWVLVVGCGPGVCGACLMVGLCAQLMVRTLRGEYFEQSEGGVMDPSADLR